MGHYGTLIGSHSYPIHPFRPWVTLKGGTRGFQFSDRSTYARTVWPTAINPHGGGTWFRGSANHQMAPNLREQVPSAPHFRSSPAFSYTLWRRTTKFDALIHMGRACLWGEGWSSCYCMSHCFFKALLIFTFNFCFPSVFIPCWPNGNSNFEIYKWHRLPGRVKLLSAAVKRFM